MQLEIGKIYNGKVKGITQYGAFVDIEGGGTGMVHISEIANTYVSNIRDHLSEEQEVKVKVIGINEAGKVSLSIKKAVDSPAPQQQKNSRPRSEGGQNRPQKPNIWEPKKQTPPSEMTFEDMMSRFKQSSEERMCDLKRSTDRKNGTRRK
ncbi:S1 RNA-binding domain-containing protein [uncultured Ruminococcus sp.]|jgi:S1 RNA binding domain protein|uniref:S1 RNA-binding domain-containing protein n=1 Tax=uncultured Ruminococcus sp. TaxID=165186 RepID=UPI001569815F|nr:S1 RNA-binding domain-containing protein [uncultured Ruminococcus sp.]